MAWTMGSEAEANTLKEIFATNSPRITTLMCAAILDGALEDALRRRFVRHEKFEGIMFDPANGALGPFMPKVYLGFLLGMYDLDCRDALSGIAKIRNIFAHRLGHVDSLSADPDLTKGFQYLTLHKKYTHYPAINELQGEGIKIAAPINEGDIFIVNFRILRMILLNDKFYHRNRSNDRATPQEMIDYFDQEYGRGTWLRKYGAESPLDQ